MRAVERTPWAERRTSMHDTMCAAVVSRPDALLYWFDVPTAPVRRVVPEYPCGPGFLDVLIERADVNEAYLVEVKTEAEGASAGDVIRQLQWYSAQLKGYDQKHLVCITESCITAGDESPFYVLTKAAGIRLVHWPCFNRIRDEVIDGRPDEWDKLFDGPWSKETA